MINISNVKSKKKTNAIRKDIIKKVAFDMALKLEAVNKFDGVTKDDLEAALSEVLFETKNKVYIMKYSDWVNWDEFVDVKLDTLNKEKRFFNEIWDKTKNELKIRKRIHKHQEEKEETPEPSPDEPKELTLNQKKRMLQKEFKKLAKEHELNYNLEFTNTTRRLGSCNYTKKIIRLSNLYTESNDLETMMNTLRHEIAHALSVKRHGLDGRGHGILWKEAALELGAEPKACSHDSEVPELKWIVHCDHCNQVLGQRSTRPRRRGLVHKACRKPVRFQENPNYYRVAAHNKK